MSTPTKYEGHTPREWRASGGSLTVPKCHVIAGTGKDSYALAHVFGETDQERMANARLIADAPELLAENIRLREALRTIAANTQSAQVKFVAEQALAAGKGERDAM